jgi:hypothetical protein
MLRFLSLICLAMLSIVGCQTTNSDYGSGYLTMSSTVLTRFQGYLAREDGSYFAVSTDGQYYGYSYCTWGAFNCEDSLGNLALKVCHSHSNGVPCKIYAVEDKVVWQGLRNTGKSEKGLTTETGRGEIKLTTATKTHFEKYLGEVYPQYFATTKEGDYSGYSYCSNMPCLHSGMKALAVSACEARARHAKRCFVYAKKQEIVWK